MSAAADTLEKSSDYKKRMQEFLMRVEEYGIDENEYWYRKIDEGFLTSALRKGYVKWDDKLQTYCVTEEASVFMTSLYDTPKTAYENNPSYGVI